MAWVATIWAVTVLASAPPSAEMCEFMSVREAPAEVEDFVGARKAQQEGNWTAAARMFHKRLSTLSTNAERYLFEDRNADAGPAATFVQKRLVSKTGSLHPRLDVVSLRQDLWLWGAYLQCRAGHWSRGQVYLKSLWRDYADTRTGANAVLMALAFHRLGDVEGTSIDQGVAEGRIASGALACSRGAPDRGRVLLKRALEELKREDPRRGVIENWIQRCDVRKPRKGGTS